MATVNVYLTFNGNCEEAFNFYKSVFGGEFAYIGRFDEMPDHVKDKLPETDKKRIMHVSLPVSNETVLMGSDTTSDYGNVKYGNNFAVSVNTESRDEADRLFNGLSDGGNIIMPMQETFWNAYFGMFEDKFGINWMVNYDIPTDS